MSSLSDWLLKLGRPAVLAHRGASRAAPENSLAALRIAAELGADGVEFDVQACATGELVVFHDRTLSRCTGALGSVGETSWSDLQRLTLDRVPHGARGERIPLLEEWLDRMPKGLFVNLEVKAEVFAEAAQARRCADALVRSGHAGASVLSSFHPAAIWNAGRAVDRGALVEAGTAWRAVLALGWPARPAAVHPQSKLVTPARVRAWKRLGLRVATWTVDSPDEAARCLDAGVDIIISNRPDRIRSVVEKYRR